MADFAEQWAGKSKSSLPGAAGRSCRSYLLVPGSEVALCAASIASRQHLANPLSGRLDGSPKLSRIDLPRSAPGTALPLTRCL